MGGKANGGVEVEFHLQLPPIEVEGEINLEGNHRRRHPHPEEPHFPEEEPFPEEPEVPYVAYSDEVFNDARANTVLLLNEDELFRGEKTEGNIRKEADILGRATGKGLLSACLNVPGNTDSLLSIDFGNIQAVVEANGGVVPEPGAPYYDLTPNARELRELIVQDMETLLKTSGISNILTVPVESINDVSGDVHHRAVQTGGVAMDCENVTASR